MALSISSLTDYVIENENLLVTKSLFSGRTSDLILQEGTVMTGVKFAEKINILATDAIFQAGTGCTKTPSGTTSITQRQVTIGEIIVVEDICVNTLNTKYTSKALAKGNTNKLPFEQEYANLKADTIAKQLEVAIWQGDTSHGDENLKRFDGFLKLIDAASPVLSNNPAYTGAATTITTVVGIVPSNVKGVVDSVWLALPADVQGQDDVRIFCGWDTFYKYIAAYRDQNLFNFAPSGSEVSVANGVIIIPGTNYKLTAVHGLDGTARLIGARMSNLFAGVDLENEYEKFKIMEDQFGNYLRFQASFKYGVNFAFPAEIVSFKLV